MPSYPCAALGAIARNADLCPNAPALIEPDGKTFNYNELWQQIEAVSEQLQGAGVGAGERVAVLLPQGALQILAVAGVLNRHIAVPLQAKTTPVEVQASLRRLSTSALIVSPEFSAEAEAANKAGFIVLVARDGQSPRDWEVRASAFPSKPAAVRSEAVLLLITSATTDRSKVVPLTGANLDAGNAATRDTAQLVDSDRLLLMVSLCHRIGVESAFAQFLAGGAVIATAGFDPTCYLHWLNGLRPTWYVCAPAVHQASLAQLKVALPAAPLSLRLLQSAGAPLPDSVRDELERALGVPVLNGYGATEAHYIAIESVPFNGHIPNAAGRPCGSEIGIMNSSRELLTTGEEGEIAVRGPAVFSGYENDDEANRNAFHDGWFRTGDLGRLDQDGNLFVTGRLKEMINRGGEKILPGEVDEVFASHPAVLYAAAFPVPHPTLGEDVACAIVLRSDIESPVSIGELRRFAMDRLPIFKVPNRIHFVDEIPRGELGKPQRWLLAESLKGRNAAPPTPAEVSGEIAVNGYVVILHEIWSRILAREDLGFDEDFFEAGGDSLAAINMLAEVDRRYDSHTSAAAARFIDEPTLRNLGTLVRESAPPGPIDDTTKLQIFPVWEGGSNFRLFCFTPPAVEGLSFRRLSKYLHGEMDVFIVRPANTRYSSSLFTFENAATEATALIRQVQPHGPYFLSGHCFGGVVAFETARQLLLDGQEVRLIFFETLLPGFPSFFHDWQIWIRAIGRQWKRLWTREHPGLIGNLQIFAHRFLWAAVRVSRRLLVPIQNVPLIHKIIQMTQVGDYPPYKARPLNARCLHILSPDEPSTLDPLEAASRFGWRKFFRGGITEEYVAFDHHNVLHESNLPVIAETLLQWCGASSEALEFPQVSFQKNDFS